MLLSRLQVSDSAPSATLDKISYASLLHYCDYVFCGLDAGGVSNTATVRVTLKETNDFPPQLFPLRGSVCRHTGPASSGLLVTAADGDLAPHAAPFTFQIPADLSANWTVVGLNGK